MNTNGDVRMKKNNARLLFRSDPLMQVCWATWECLRRLGFDSDEIFVGWQPEKQMAFMALNTQDKQYGVLVWPKPDYDMDEFVRRWALIGEGVNAGQMKLSEMEKAFDRVFSNGMAVKMVDDLIANGIDIPNLSMSPGGLKN